MATCPICQASFNASSIEKHVEACLALANLDGGSQPQPVRPKSPIQIAPPSEGPLTLNDITLPHAPIFRPTMEEFSDPYRYIAKISEEGQKYGICLIIPPVKPKHKVTDLLDPRLFSFNTKLQPLHQLLRRWSAPSEIFLAKLHEFRHQHQPDKKHLARQCPKVRGNALDLFRLFRCVILRGGAAAVSARSEWSQVRLQIGFFSWNLPSPFS